MVAVPAVRPETRPEEETVAMVVLEEDQLPPAEPLEDICEVPFTHIACVPESEPALGAAVTVMLMDAVSALHPPDPATM